MRGLSLKDGSCQGISLLFMLKLHNFCIKKSEKGRLVLSLLSQISRFVLRLSGALKTFHFSYNDVKLLYYYIFFRFIFECCNSLVRYTI